MATLTNSSVLSFIAAIAELSDAGINERHDPHRDAPPIPAFPSISSVGLGLTGRKTSATHSEKSSAMLLKPSFGEGIAMTNLVELKAANARRHGPMLPG